MQNITIEGSKIQQNKGMWLINTEPIETTQPSEAFMK